MASNLWLVMQVIEANRHSAEQLETAASTADPRLAPILSKIAAQSRRFADEVYEALKSGSVTAENDVDSDPIEAPSPTRRSA
jgi:hypothetical protein